MATSFGLARAGYEDGTLDTQCTVTLEQKDGGFTVTQSALVLSGRVPGLSAEQFADIAAEAEKNCPISRLLNCAITLDATLEP